MPGVVGQNRFQGLIRVLHAKISLVLIYLARLYRKQLVRARVVKSVDTADLKSADSKKSCRFDSGLGHQKQLQDIHNTSPLMNLAKLLLCSCLAFSSLAWGVDVLEFNCKRSEKNYIEEYEMKLTLASGSQKAKLYLDGRDLDQSDAFGTQIVKSIILARPNILIAIEAKFEPEEIMGVSYPAGTVLTNITLDPVTGKFKKVEKIQGGILGATIGNGTHISEEICLPSKMPYKAK